MFEGSVVQFESFEEMVSYGLFDVFYQDGYLFICCVNGEVMKQVWVLIGLVSMEQLIEFFCCQIEVGGYVIMFDCDFDSCGGFDFCFNIDVVFVLEMFVDFQDFCFVLVMKEFFIGSEVILVLVSCIVDLGLMQIILVVLFEVEVELLLFLGILLGSISVIFVIVCGFIILVFCIGGCVVLSDLSFQIGFF